MENRELVKEMIMKGREAVTQVENYTQEQADELAKAVGRTIYNNAELISEEAANETGMGTKEDKTEKHLYILDMFAYMKGKPSVGILSEDHVNNTITIAKPMGIIGAITPSTNPTTTAAFVAINALKGLNAVVVCAHPRAKQCTMHCVELIREELKKIGAPCDLVQAIEDPTIELSGILMEEADAIVAVGGAGMVKAAYSHGRPSMGVGQGNVQCILDEDYPDIETMVQMTIVNRRFDMGVPCTGDQTVYVPKKNKEEVFQCFRDNGAYIIDNKKDIEEFRKKIFNEKGINRDVVGKEPKDAFAALGIDIPDCKLAMIELTEGTGEREVLCKEILFPIVRLVVYDKFEDAVAMAKGNLLVEGAGHSSVIWSKDKDKVLLAGLKLPVGRLMVEQINSDASGNPRTNGLAPTLAIGCGTWGGNSICENLTYYHLLNKTIISRPLEEPREYGEELWK